MSRIDWKETQLGDLISIKHGFAFPGKNITDLETDNILVTPGHFNIGGGFKNVHKKFFNGDIDEEYILEEGDLIITMTDLSKKGETLGYSAIVPKLKNKKLLHNQRIGKVKINNPDIKKSFLNYLLRDKHYRHWILSTSTGSTVRHTSPSRIEEFKFFLPSIEEQSNIAEVLLPLDSKIELNQKMNETLEEIAKTLFKSWFIDFDPVRAKAEGRPTGLSKEISDLFPDSLEDSELGEIPSGWKISSLGDKSFEIESGKRPKGGINKKLKTGIPSVGAESVSSIGTFNYSKEKLVTHKFYETCLKGKVKNNDVALYKDGGKPGLFMPRVALYGEGFPYKEFLVNEHVFLLRSTELGQFFLYHLINSSFMMREIIEKGSAKAAQPGLNQEEVKSCKFISPPTNLIDEFNKIIKPSIKKQLILGIESNTLTNLRDTLLPKLISGNLIIPGAEEIIEEAGV
tara:strand:+ start:3463 stop:4833 length:1371 start_codon:yes stop_codon:yes gene_type:complete